MPLNVRYEGEVAVITWDDGENRVNPDSMSELQRVLDELTLTSGPLGLVLTGTGKFFSNGLDLERFGERPEELGKTLRALHRVVARLVTFPAYTVAALNGHTFAAGALLSCGFDRRVMRADRGYWCMNEVDIGLPLDQKLAAILFARLPRPAVLEAILTGRRFSAYEALAAGIVEETAPEEHVLERAVALAQSMAHKDRAVIGAHKRIAFASLLGDLDVPDDF